MPSHKPYPHTRPFQELSCLGGGRRSPGDRRDTIWKTLKWTLCKACPAGAYFMCSFGARGCRGGSPAARSPLALPTQVK